MPRLALTLCRLAGFAGSPKVDTLLRPFFRAPVSLHMLEQIGMRIGAGDPALVLGGHSWLYTVPMARAGLDGPHSQNRPTLTCMAVLPEGGRHVARIVCRRCRWCAEVPETALNGLRGP